jgi:hypothetical protein
MNLPGPAVGIPEIIVASVGMIVVGVPVATVGIIDGTGSVGAVDEGAINGAIVGASLGSKVGVEVGVAVVVMLMLALMLAS